VTPYTPLLMTSNITATSLMVSRFIWAAIGGIVLSVIIESIFVGSRRGRVITT
jgi:hypothetical protein